VYDSNLTKENNMIIFKNKGIIDIRSITTFGVSSKENDNAIGYFGTGLKYAIAILLREGCEITIHAGSKKYEFKVKTEKIRADKFDTVTMNGQRLAFTTELGKNWELWQAFRELYCNTKDEFGEIFECNNYEPDSKDTTIIIKGNSFIEIWKQRHNIILEAKPIYSNEDIEIHLGESDYIFYKGIRTQSLGKKCKFTWNILRNMTLTEDRTLAYPYLCDNMFVRVVSECPNVNLVKELLTIDENYKEYHIDYSYISATDSFLDILLPLVQNFTKNLNVSAASLCRKHRSHVLDNLIPLELNIVQTKQFNKALTFCKNRGFNVTEYPIVITEFLGSGVLGRAQNGTIYISSKAFTMGTKCLAGTLIEEYVHLKHQFYDCTIEFQNYLIDTIVSMGELIDGEPL
jgi:hypothetical protein